MMMMWVLTIFPCFLKATICPDSKSVERRKKGKREFLDSVLPASLNCELQFRKVADHFSKLRGEVTTEVRILQLPPTSTWRRRSLSPGR